MLQCFNKCTKIVTKVALNVLVHSTIINLFLRESIEALESCKNPKSGDSEMSDHRYFFRYAPEILLDSHTRMT